MGGSWDAFGTILGGPGGAFRRSGSLLAALGGCLNIFFLIFGAVGCFLLFLWFFFAFLGAVFALFCCFLVFLLVFYVFLLFLMVCCNFLLL